MPPANISAIPLATLQRWATATCAGQTSRWPDILRAYLRLPPRPCSTCTSRAYLAALVRWLHWAAKHHTSPSAPGIDMARRYIEHRSLKPDGTPYAPSTIAGEIAGLRAAHFALEWAGAKSLPPCPWARIRAPLDPRPTHLIRPPTPPEIVAALIAATNLDTRLRLCLILASRIGLRPGEICALTTDDRDPTAHTLSIRGKGGRPRQLPLPPDVDAAWTTWSHGHPHATRLWPHGDRALRRALQRLAQSIGVPSLGWHALRHRAATDAYARCHDLLAVSRILGHSTTQHTARYADADPDVIVAALGTSPRPRRGHH